LYAVTLVPVSLLPTLLGVTGRYYFFGALALGLGYVAAAAVMTRSVTLPRAWRVFLVSIVYLPALLTLMVLDKAVRLV
jgi:protoheme IX farnesyltransferase